MTQQELGGGTGEPSLTEEVQTQPQAAAEAGTETPAVSKSVPAALNRAERRAQAKGKKNAAGPNQALTNNSAHGPSGRTTGHVGQVRFPRTGHK